jgi:hypothetical protein
MNKIKEKMAVEVIWNSKQNNILSYVQIDPISFGFRITIMIHHAEFYITRKF